MTCRNDPLIWLGIIALIVLCSATSKGRGEMLSNENFIVFAPDQLLAEEVLERAEQLRREIAVEWFGEELSKNAGRTLIHVRFSDTEDSGLTWVKNTSDPKQTFHRMWLTTTREDATGSLLAHEMVHSVFATKYPQGFPAWVEEGIAGLYDGSERRIARRQIVKGWDRTGRQPDRDRILQAKGIATTDSDTYCLSCFLVKEMLVKYAGDKKALIRFALSRKQVR